MIVTVQYFGLIVDAIGKNSEDIEWNENQKKLREFFEDKHPVLKTIHYKIAINNELTEEIPENSTNIKIALLPPFAGG